MKKKIFSLITSVLVVIVMVTSVFALTNPTSFYDARSWTWIYDAPATTSYNCLGYATNSMIWEWPWIGDPTLQYVTTYLNTIQSLSPAPGYNKAKIACYGSTNAIKHFSLITGGNPMSGTCTAKWGTLERFKHNSWAPYYSDSSYGPYVQYFGK